MGAPGKILLDLNKLREYGDVKVEAVMGPVPLDGGFKTVRELATFAFTCRRCVDAPCMASCPVHALERDPQGMINRSLNLCIRCKSCILMCPFGTLMNDLFKTRTSGVRYFDITREEELISFANSFPDDVVALTGQEADPENHIHALNERVLAKEKVWNPEPA